MTDQQLDVDPSRSPLRVVAAVVFDNEKVLACRRNSDKAAGGMWEFPGGKIEQDENPDDALVREIQEELGISIIIDNELSTDLTSVDGRMIQLTCFRAYLKDVRPLRSSDHDQLLWLPVADLEQLEWAEPDLPAVRRLVAAANAS